MKNLNHIALLIAMSQIGIKEIAGPGHNPEILKYFEECGFLSITDDETAWCSAFMCWCNKKAGMPFPKNGLAAQSWLGWGTEVFEPEIGDKVILKRPPHVWTGHVGILLRRDGSNIWMVSGNANDQIGVGPYHGSQLLGYRRWEP